MSRLVYLTISRHSSEPGDRFLLQDNMQKPYVLGLWTGQPEAYENPMFVAALNSVTSGQLTTGRAAEKFGVRETSLIATLSWTETSPTSAGDTASTSLSLIHI